MMIVMVRSRLMNWGWCVGRVLEVVGMCFCVVNELVRVSMSMIGRNWLSSIVILRVVLNYGVFVVSLVNVELLLFEVEVKV